MNSLSSDSFDNATFENFSRYIYNKTGIVVSESKKTHLSNRLRSRVKELKLTTFSEYWDYLIKNESLGNELYVLFDAVSTNETYFQRGTTHYNTLEKFILPEYYKAGKHRLSIWSSGTSTGEEAYDLAMIAYDFECSHPEMEIEITGTDISNKALGSARTGEYCDRRIDKLSPEQLRFFSELKPEESSLPYGRKVIRVNDNLRKKVSFQFLNLISDTYLMNVDIIFCRNVLIYFDRDTQKEIIEKFSRSLNLKGYLFIGHSESLQLVPNNLTLVQTPFGSVYKKETL